AGRPARSPPSKASLAGKCLQGDGRWVVGSCSLQWRSSPSRPAWWMLAPLHVWRKRAATAIMYGAPGLALLRALFLLDLDAPAYQDAVELALWPSSLPSRRPPSHVRWRFCMPPKTLGPSVSSGLPGPSAAPLSWEVPRPGGENAGVPTITPSCTVALGNG